MYTQKKRVVFRCNSSDSYSSGVNTLETAGLQYCRRTVRPHNNWIVHTLTMYIFCIMYIPFSVGGVPWDEALKTNALVWHWEHATDVN